MNRSQLYVGIFGREFSERTVDEFHDAVKRGMSPLVYYYTEPPSVLKSKAESSTKDDLVYDFLVNQVKPTGLVIRGNYNRIVIRTQPELEDEIVADLSAEMLEMIWRHHNVQKAVKGLGIF